MLEHPGNELQVLIKEKGLTQKAFASILGKKVSEVNELLKGKRNITIQRDYLLHQTLGTPIKYWILKQIDYDYSLLDIENISLPVRGAAEQSEAEGLSESHGHSEALAEESISTDSSSGATAKDLKGETNELDIQVSSSQTSENETLSSSGASAKDLKGEDNELHIQDSSSSLHSSSEGQTNSQETPTEKSNPKDDEDLENRAKIFRTF